MEKKESTDPEKMIEKEFEKRRKEIKTLMEEARRRMLDLRYEYEETRQSFGETPWSNKIETLKESYGYLEKALEKIK